eukprot:CAMPEP_0181108648 /NCGR_PEP_ID=MMETSP1071-20121207/17742_1 /TAXON_ID=35127 /ORGANISM="Thalassiosira sp., Strain NH16" /LENGTH=1002 /DNA_ID=CAMNT_0023192265 /DNA_START=14 /DNA_END=3022 /DNA_ORIENTATION=+
MGANNIQVAVRVRPFLPFESGSKSCIDVLPGEDDDPSPPPPSSSSTQLSQGKSVRIGPHGHVRRDGRTFTFDRCFSGLATQVEIYNTLVAPLLAKCLEGYNATTVAYGQTGAGKTYTTLGPATSPDFFNQQNGVKHSQEYDAVGILPRTLRDLFLQLQRKRQTLCEQEGANPAAPANDENNVAVNEKDSIGIQPTKSPVPKRNSSDSNASRKEPFEYHVKLQFLELYGEEVRDLLTTTSSQAKIRIRDTGGDAEALGATAVSVATAQEAMVALTRGMLRRVTGATAMNAESSRVVRRSKFNFVDLAGSERQKRTNAKGQRLREGININKGLLVLGNVISALASGDEKKFVPFRDSKLTRLLRGSLGGNHRTLMIACASPAQKNAEESLNCLRYANRAKNIQNVATVNVDPHSKLVNALRGQVTAMAGELLRLSNRGGGKVDNDRFSLELLEVLVKGGKEAQAVEIGSKGKAGAGPPPSSADSKSPTAAGSDAQSASPDELAAELEETRRSLEETRRGLREKSEELEAVVSERDDLRRDADEFANSNTASPPSRTSFSTPSKAIGMARGESIRDILTTLSTADDVSDADALSSDAMTTISEGTEKIANGVEGVTDHRDKLQTEKIKELSSEVETLRSSLDRLTQLLDEKSEELDSALEINESLKEQLRDTPDIDEETMHNIVKHITSYDDQRMEDFHSEDEEEDASSVASSTSSVEEDEGRKERNEELSNFASAMFSTGKFLVDRELFEDSIVCFETVLEVRRELYGWDDPLVGDALHMEGFVRSKMGDYDRALMLLWDALRIRKIANEPLKISATLRLLADLHFSKEENMHAALFYEECARHLKEHDINDPHLPLVLIDLARTKDRLGEYAESMTFFEQALALYGHALDHDDDRIASLQYEMGVLAFQMGERDRGEECFRHFIRIRKSKGSSMDEGVANALFVLGSLHWATKKRDLAQDCWHEALDIFKGLGRMDDDPYVKSLKDKLHRAQRRPITRIFRGS